MDADEISAWLRLTQAEGVGPATGRQLLAAFGLPQQIFEASFGQLSRIVAGRIAQTLCASPDEKLQALIASTVDWANTPGNDFLTLADPRYPRRLLDITDPPLVLYAKGRMDLLETPAIAIVGSRNATAQGIANAERFAESLAQAGWMVVSGLALGIDTAAHEGALKAGSTLAVIGTGADIVYPARNRNLAHRIAENGLLLSEFPLGTAAIAHNFPRRNRIISGLTRGVLVVEAAAQSGSLITARLAGEQGREVFAIPGSIHSPLSKGCHRLIKEGAKLVESAQDVLEELGEATGTVRAEPDDAAASADCALLNAMGYDPVLPDELAVRAEWPLADVTTQLLELELAGLVSRMPGGRYQRLSK